MTDIMITEEERRSAPPAATIKTPRCLKPMPVPAEQSKKARARNAQKFTASAWCNVCGGPLTLGKRHKCSGKWEV